MRGSIRRRVRLAAAWAVMLGVCLGLPAGAARGDSPDRPPWLRDPVSRGPLAGTAAFDDRWTYWSLDSGLPLGAMLPWRERARPDSLHDIRPLASLTLSLAGVFDHHAGDAGTVHYAAILQRGARAGGGWLGLSSGAGGAPSEPGTRLMLAAGAWRSIAPVQVEVGMVSSMVRLVDPTRWFEVTHARVEASSDTLPGRDTTLVRAVDHVALWTTGQGALRWRVGRVELETVTGFTFGDEAPMLRWAQGTVRVQVARQLMLIASAGRRPAPSLAFDVTAMPRTMIGLQLAPWASSSWAMAGGIRPRARSWMARPLADDRVAIHLRCQDTRMVELAADFTDWAPVAMSPIGGGWWELVAPAEAGIHHVRVRLDHGSWQVPPGLLRADDGYDQPTGVLILD
ncbi:MAG: hypothetical protein ACHQ52_08910 [Candidatus Eisenbacteria bacterium]